MRNIKTRQMQGAWVGEYVRMNQLQDLLDELSWELLQ